MSQMGNGKKKNDGPPPCDVVTSVPVKSGSALSTTARVTSMAEQVLILRIVIRQHRRFLPDEEIAHWDDEVPFENGEKLTQPLEGKCKSGKHQYFAKVTARNKAFSGAAEHHSVRAEFTC